MHILTPDIIIRVLEYTQKIIDPAYNPNKVNFFSLNLINFKDILYKVLYIITEFCEMFQANVKKYIDIQKIEYLLKTFKESNEDPTYEDFLIWSEEVIFAILYNN